MDTDQILTELLAVSRTVSVKEIGGMYRAWALGKGQFDGWVCYGDGETVARALQNLTAALAAGRWRRDKYSRAGEGDRPF